MAFAKEGHAVLSGDMAGVIRVWKRNDRAADAVDLKIRDLDAPAALSGDGRTLVAAQPDGTLRVWRVATGPASSADDAGKLAGHAKRVVALAVNETGTVVVSAGEDDALRIWKIPAAGPVGEVRPLKVALADPACVAVSGRNVAAVGKDGLRWWDWTTGDIRFKPTSVGRPTAAAFSPDGTLLVTAGGSFIQAWDAATGEERLVGMGLMRHPIRRLAVGPSHAKGGGWTAAAVDTAGAIKAWDIAPGPDGKLALKDRELPPAALAHGVECVAFSDDGRSLATGGADRMVRLWDPETGQERAALAGHAADVYLTAFRGDVLLSVGRDGVLRLWRGGP